VLLAPAFLDELRARTLLSGLIGRSLKLQRAGREFKACCPFHNEKTASFYVNDEKGFYHCFGCGAHGDAIRFLTDAQGLSFMDAVKELVEAAGMEMPAPDRHAAEKAERAQGLHAVTDAAARWFGEQLAGIGGAAARAYLDRRGVSAEIRAAFGLGFAPDSRSQLKTALDRFGAESLIETGLLIAIDDKPPYDRFRGRLMIPIRDPRGRTIAFGGRLLGEGEPKYLNSPETPLFDKGHTLFNLDRAAPASRKTDRLFVVEGYMDVIALAQAGVNEAVAPLGTALTEHQLSRLWRIVDTPTLCFDGDKAGVRAGVRAAERALPLLTIGKSLQFALLPGGEDPDDIVRRGGAAAWAAAVVRPKPLVALLYEAERDGIDRASPEARAGLRHRLNGLAESCTDKLVAEEYRRTFTSLFFDDFGWKRRDRDEVHTGIIRTGPHGQRALTNLYVRSALYGLTRFPWVIAPRMEAISDLRLDHPDLLRWRDALLTAAVTRPALDTDGVSAILETATLTDVQRSDMQYDLRFPFTVDRTDAGFAIERLVALIDMLNEERELDEEMARLNAVMIADTGLSRYEAIEAQRQSVREKKFRLREHGFELGSRETVVSGGK
jgi:DNA primase